MRDTVLLASALQERYRLEHELGQGGMATVYRARDLKHDRPVALKVLRPELAAALGAERFLQEIRVTAGLQHPRILPLIDSGEAGGFVYYVMPFVDGDSLRARMDRERQLPVDEAVRITRGIAAALDFAHRNGVVHRDVKPENILVYEGEPLVADFGIALALGEAGDRARLTRTGIALGTPAYMSPEQSTGERELDGRSDQYSLACVLYEMLAGEPPYTGPNAQAIVAKRLTEPLPRLGTVRSVPAPIEHALTRALCKSPADRFRTVGEFAAALDQREGALSWLRRRRVRVGLAAAAVLLVSIGTLAARSRAAGRVDPAMQAGTTIPTVGVTTHSVAVLPMVNTSGDPENEHFSDGLTDELIGALSKVDSLRVSGRTSSFALKGKNLSVRSVADTLHVASVLEGSVRRAGDRLKVAVQLVNADGSILWSDSYDRMLKDVFAVQEEIAQAVVHSLRVKLGAARGPLVRPTTSDLVAYDLYLKGRFIQGRLIPDALTRAIGYFEQAVARDSTFARAYAWLADVHTLIIVFGSRPAREEIPRARTYALKALALDSTLADGHWALAQILFVFDWDWTRAEREFKRALELEPGNAEARHLYAIQLFDEGRFDEAKAELQRVIAGDPLFAPASMTLGRVYSASGHPDEAIAHLREALELEPTFAYARAGLGHAYLQKRMFGDAIREFERAASTGAARDSAQLAYAYAVTGRRADALALLRVLLTSGDGRYPPPFHIAMAYVGLGDKDEAFRWLQRATSERDPHVTGLNRVPAFEPLRSDPRFAPLIREMGLKP